MVALWRFATNIVARKAVARKNRPPVGRDGWFTAAREALIREGIAGVQIGKLARRLKVTRGGFYWFFSSRAAFLDELLIDWERTNIAAMKAVLVGAEHDGMAELNAVVEMMLTGKSFVPPLDAAIRDWGRQTAKVARAVRRVDDARIDVFKQIFLDMGCDDDEAFVRARICYFHQVGYYTLDVQESRGQRMRLLPLYLKYLTGR